MSGSPSIQSSESNPKKSAMCETVGRDDHPNCLTVNARAKTLPQDKLPSKGLSIPTGRVSRLARLVTMASDVGGGMILDGLYSWSKAKVPV
jgi:hypothetical protein